MVLADVASAVLKEQWSRSRTGRRREKDARCFRRRDRDHLRHGSPRDYLGDCLTLDSLNDGRLLVLGRVNLDILGFDDQVKFEGGCTT